MKKLAIGCGVVMLAVGVIVVGIGYYGYFKLRGTVTQFAELGKLPEIEREVRVKTPFTPPASGDLTASQLDRLMEVQKRVRDRLGENAAAFERTYKSLGGKKRTTATDLPALLSAYREPAPLWLYAQPLHVAAPNAAGM